MNRDLVVFGSWGIVSILTFIWLIHEMRKYDNISVDEMLPLAFAAIFFPIGLIWSAAFHWECGRHRVIFPKR